LNHPKRWEKNSRTSCPEHLKYALKLSGFSPSPTPQSLVQKMSKNKKIKKESSKGTKLAILNRRKRVMDYISRGMGLQETADSLGVDIRTISRDLDLVRAKLAKEYLKPNMIERVAQLNNAQNRRVKRLWTIILDKSSSKRDIINALSQVREEEKLQVKKDQILGVLPRDTADVQIANIVGGKQETINQVSIFNTLKVIKAEDAKFIDIKKK